MSLTRRQIFAFAPPPRILALVAALIVVCTLAFFWRLAFTDSILARGDTFTYFYPYWHARNAALLSGGLPLWSPDLFAGVPLLANSQLGTFYPPNWIVAPLAPPDGIRVSILLHVAWAGVGVYLLARRMLGVGSVAALASAAIFAFGGHVGAHVEQINQLQGLAWLPWLIYLFDRAVSRPLPGAILLGMGLALQFFTGHTQTVFITGAALAIYAITTRPIRGGLTLAGAGLIALALASPQLIPTLELTDVSNRRGGLNVNQATAFSFSPFVTGRGLLPSYDTSIFGEYVAYPGVIGLGLAVVGIFTAGAGLKPAAARRFRIPFSPRTTWLIIALVGLALAYGLYNPVYWVLAMLPGFDLFRVPARWLALFALGAALLAGLGVETMAQWARRTVPLQGQTVRRLSGFICVVVAVLAALTLLTPYQNDGTPASLPTPLSLAGWAAALVALLVGVWRRSAALLVGAALVELWVAAGVMPYNDLVPPEAYSAQRFSISQMLAYNEAATTPERVLSISRLLFDPGDRAALEARYADLAPEARALAFDAVKLKEVIGANLPLIWGIPSADGFDGGLLPTAYYTAFTSLLLPDGMLRTVDGRLREVLALPECGGACIPDQRWLDLLGVRYLITDKIYDAVHEGIFYDTTFTTTAATYGNPQGFVADAVDVLCQACADASVTIGDTRLTVSSSADAAPYTRLRFAVDPPAAPDAIRVEADAPIRAVTMVDTRTDDFQQLTPDPWTRVLSSDVKLYRNAETPRAFVVGAAHTVSDDENGTEAALALMRDPAFDYRETVILSGILMDVVETPGGAPLQTITIAEYADTRIIVRVETDAAGYLVLADAYYPGWVATVNDEPVPVVRADVMFRAVAVPAGQSEVIFEYQPAWLPGALVFGGAAWIAALVGVAAAGLVARNHRQ